MRTFLLSVAGMTAVSCACSLWAIDLGFPDGIHVHRVAGSGLLVPVGDANADGMDDLAKNNPRASPQTGSCLLAVYGALTHPPTRVVPAVGGQFCSNGNTDQELPMPRFSSSFCGAGSNSIVFGGNGYNDGQLHSMPKFGRVDFQTIFRNCGGGTLSKVGDMTGDGAEELWVGQGFGGRFLRSPCGPGVHQCGPAVDVANAGGLAPTAVNLGDVGGSASPDVAFSSSNTVFALFNMSHANLSEMTAAQGFRVSSALSGSVSAIVGNVDFNGDGLLDIGIGYGGASTSGLTSNGRVYVVYGRTGGFPFETDLDAPSPHVSRIDGIASQQSLGSRLAAPDFDDDGTDDIVISGDLGEAYVLFGQGERFENGPISTLVENAAVIRMPSPRAVDAVASGFDFNDDGREDLGLSFGNDYFVVFGRSNSLFSSSFEE